MFWIFVTISEIIYVLIVLRRLQQPILDLHLNSDLFFILVALVLLFILYFGFYRLINWKQINTKKIFLVSILFQVTFLFTPFLTSDDIYTYVFSSRLLPIWGVNPYTVPFDSFPQDPIYQQIKTMWSSYTVLYGPLFLHIGAALNLIGQNSFNILIFLFKAAFIGANIANCLLVYKLTNSNKALFLYGSNPLIVFELAGNGHLDSMLILFLLISFFLVSKKPVFGFTSLIASVLIRYSTIVLAPFFSVYILRKAIRSFALALVLSLVLVIAVYIPFWTSPDIFNYLISYYNEVSPFPSLGILAGLVIFESYKVSFNVNTLLFLLILIILTIKSFRSKNDIAQLIFFSMLLYWVFLLTKLNLVLTWYLAPLIAISSLCLISKKYSNYGVKSIALASLYSLVLYWWVR